VENTTPPVKAKWFLSSRQQPLFSDLGFSFFWEEEKGKKAQKERRKIPKFEFIKKERDENERERSTTPYGVLCVVFFSRVFCPPENRRKGETVRECASLSLLPHNNIHSHRVGS